MKKIANLIIILLVFFIYNITFGDISAEQKYYDAQLEYVDAEKKYGEVLERNNNDPDNPEVIKAREEYLPYLEKRNAALDEYNTFKDANTTENNTTQEGDQTITNTNDNTGPGTNGGSSQSSSSSGGGNNSASNDIKNGLLNNGGTTNIGGQEEDGVLMLQGIFIWIKDMLNSLLILISVGAFLFIGLRLVFARGNPEEFKKAIMQLVYAVVGLLIVGLSYVLVVLVSGLTF